MAYEYWAMMQWGLEWLILSCGAKRYFMDHTSYWYGAVMVWYGWYKCTWSSSNPNYSIHYWPCERTILWWLWEEWWRPWWGVVFEATECRFQTVSLFIPIWFKIYCSIKSKLVRQSNHVENSSSNSHQQNRRFLLILSVIKYVSLIKKEKEKVYI